MSSRVNLDAMIPREDFARQEGTFDAAQRIMDFRLDYLKMESPIRVQLRKPDFQRETNHWNPDQVSTFVASFVDEEVIPALILWKSNNYIFVIDGGHRLSALRAWMEDDYGDGAISRNFYNGEISDDQRRTAKRARQLVEERIGRFSTLSQLVAQRAVAVSDIQQVRANRMFTRALQLQWVFGSPAVAETSFFKINTQGTPLDDTEEMLIRNRRKPVAISARAVLRAGAGHKYWSSFIPERQETIEELSRDLFDILFEPEIKSPIKTIDVPLGGSVSPVEALSWLIDFVTVAGNRNQTKVKTIGEYPDDESGEGTIAVLRNALEIANRISGNSAGSLGLHPAVYFYNERGKQSRFLFLGMAHLIAEVVRNNDSGWFKKFTLVRHRVESFLVENKSVIGILLQNMSRGSRVSKMRDLFKMLVDLYTQNGNVAVEEVISGLGLSGRIIDVKAARIDPIISDETKSAIAIRDGIRNGQKCPICNGLLDVAKSASYDHVRRVREGGFGGEDNVQRTHPFCNTGMKG